MASCSENLTSSARIATITVRAEGTDSVSVTITQAKSNLGTVTHGRDDLQIWPNPGGGIFTIRIPESYHGETEATVGDLNGNCLLRRSFDMEKKFTLDLSTASPGVYSLILKSKELTVVRKLVIIR